MHIENRKIYNMTDIEKDFCETIWRFFQSINFKSKYDELFIKTNFQLAFTPQITKSFCFGNKDYINLIYRVSRLSFILLFLISLPFLFNIDFILNLWLKDVPSYAPSFSFWIWPGGCCPPVP